MKAQIHRIGRRQTRRRLQHLNSTSVGGGVAEILTRLIPLLRELGIDATWDVIKGNQGQNGHEHVKANFLLTRHVRDYILTMLALEHSGESVVDLAA